MLKEIDIILSALPVLITFSAFILLIKRHWDYKQPHHLYLLIVLGLLSIPYFFSFMNVIQPLNTSAALFPLMIPINLMLMPLSFCFGYALFVGVAIPLRKMIIHMLPALFVFIGFIPFWFLTPELQRSYLSGDPIVSQENLILRNTEILRLISTYFIFHAQLIIYDIFIIIKFKKFDKEHTVTIHTHPGAGTIAIILVFFTLLLVLINNAYSLGVTINQGSRVFFNSLSTLILLPVFLSAYFKKQSIVSEKLPDVEEMYKVLDK